MSLKNRVLESGLLEITQEYKQDIHNGIDVVNQNYTLGNIVAHSDGVVVGCRNNCNGFENGSYGNYVKIKHDNVDSFKITRCPKYVEWSEYKAYYSRFKSKMRQDFTFNRQVYDCLNEKDKKYFYLAYIKRFKNEYIAKLMKCCNTTASRRTQRAFAQYKYFESKLVR